jgi:hypothetical protein
MSILTAVFLVDGKAAARLESSGYVALLLPPGEHTITQIWKAGALGNSNLEGRPISVTEEFGGGSVSNIRLSTQASSEVSGVNTMRIDFRWELRLVPESFAKAELVRCKLGEVELEFRSK